MTTSESIIKAISDSWVSLIVSPILIFLVSVASQVLLASDRVQLYGGHLNGESISIINIETREIGKNEFKIKINSGVEFTIVSGIFDYEVIEAAAGAGSVLSISNVMPEIVSTIIINDSLDNVAIINSNLNADIGRETIIDESGIIVSAMVYALIYFVLNFWFHSNFHKRHDKISKDIDGIRDELNGQNKKAKLIKSYYANAIRILISENRYWRNSFKSIMMAGGVCLHESDKLLSIISDKFSTKSWAIVDEEDLDIILTDALMQYRDK